MRERESNSERISFLVNFQTRIDSSLHSSELDALALVFSGFSRRDARCVACTLLGVHYHFAILLAMLYRGECLFRPRRMFTGDHAYIIYEKLLYSPTIYYMLYCTSFKFPRE